MKKTNTTFLVTMLMFSLTLSIFLSSLLEDFFYQIADYLVVDPLLLILFVLTLFLIILVTFFPKELKSN